MSEVMATTVDGLAGYFGQVTDRARARAIAKVIVYGVILLASMALAIAAKSVSWTIAPNGFNLRVSDMLYGFSTLHPVMVIGNGLGSFMGNAMTGRLAINNVLNPMIGTSFAMLGWYLLTVFKNPIMRTVSLFGVFIVPAIASSLLSYYTKPGLEVFALASGMWFMMIAWKVIVRAAPAWLAFELPTYFKKV